MYKRQTVDNTYLSFESTLEAALEEAYQYAREGERDERYALVEALETQPKNFEVKAEFDADEKKVGELVKKIEKELNCEVTAVSYTHLDVYKRQETGAPDKLKLR